MQNMPQTIGTNDCDGLWCWPLFGGVPYTTSNESIDDNHHRGMAINPVNPFIQINNQTTTTTPKQTKQRSLAYCGQVIYQWRKYLLLSLDSSHNNKEKVTKKERENRQIEKQEKEHEAPTNSGNRTNITQEKPNERERESQKL